MAFRNDVIRLLKKDFDVDVDSLLEIPPSPEMGDLAFPCFALSKVMKKAPPAIASELASKLKPEGIIAEIKALGPYVNFYVDKAKLAAEILPKIVSDADNYGHSTDMAENSLMIEYSSPNTNKAQHLGHVRNNLLGMALSNVLSAVGAKVIRCCLMNDRGLGVTQALLAYMKWGNGKEPDIKPDHFVADYYVMFHQKAKGDPKLEEEAKELLSRWELGDEEVIKVWKKMSGWVYEGYDETYKSLGCEFDVTYYESEIYTLGREIIKRGLDDGKFVKKEGAVVADLSKFNLPDKVLLKSDGTSLYITQDIYLANKKFEDYKIDASYYVVGSEQSLYFKQLFAVLQVLGFAWAKKCFHLSYGYVSLQSGRMKSREGTVVDADDVISDMKKLAREEIKKRHDIPDEEVEKRASEIALGAIKFFFLKYDPNMDFVFNPKESIAFEGETGPYVQYAHARVCSILRKANLEVETKADFSRLSDGVEQELVVLLDRFPSVIKDAASHNKPSLVCRYLIDVSQKFSEFYHTCPCISEDEELMKARVLLVLGVKQVLCNGLGILGIVAPSRM
ncbi:MAG: arginine--tRNA ligase [Candidatus Woesearchaeota archaeon]